MSTQPKRKLKLKKAKSLGTIWHPDTGMVFRSQKDRTVIGKYVEKKLVKELSNEDFDACEEWEFKIDESFSRTVETEPEPEPEEEESDEEESDEEEGEEADEEAETVAKKVVEAVTTEPDQEESDNDSDPEQESGTTCNADAMKAFITEAIAQHNADNLLSLQQRTSELAELQAKYDCLLAKLTNVTDILSGQ